jgi:hypothetical protein
MNDTGDYRVPVGEALKRPNRHRVMLGLPTRDEVKMDYALSLTGLCVTSALMCELIPANPRSCYVQCNRNDIVLAAFEHQCHYIMWVDGDMEFPNDGLIRLLSHNVDIVGGLYVRRDEPSTLMGKRLAGSGPLAMEGLEEMERIPAGFMLTKMDVFRKIKPPWFWLTLDETTGKIDLGDDYYFCKKARDAGFAVYADNGITAQLVHHGDAALRAPLVRAATEGARS